MVVKLDLANAFDMVSHTFLCQVMQRYGFTPDFISWVKACISKPWIALLVNGRAAPFFQASRGLRQGCPLSPLLYAIQASVLSYQLENARQEQDLPGIRIARGTKNINHAQFADDTILLGGASQIIAHRFKSEITRYCYASGSKINVRKSQIYGWNVNPREMLEISRVLNMKGVVTWESFNYLGVPIFQVKPNSSAWQHIVEKIKSKVTGWGTAWLNLAGKVILIKAVLNSYLLYQCSMILAPVKTISQIEGMLRSFLWQGGANGSKKFALVKWKIVKLPKQEGGLQIRDLRAQNLAMGSKLLWSMLAPNPSWCSMMLKCKYFPGQRLRCIDEVSPVNNGSAIYKLCMKALPQFREALCWIPGNGQSISIWNDVILSKYPPQLPRLQAWMESLGLLSLWDISTWESAAPNRWDGWAVPACPEELEEDKNRLLIHLAGLAPLAKFKKDRRGWDSGTYTALAGYQRFAASYNVPANPKKWNILWNCSSLPKIDLFIWTLLHEKI